MKNKWINNLMKFEIQILVLFLVTSFLIFFACMPIFFG